MSRKESILALRPDIPSIKVMDDMTGIEKFQNDVIRPILKYQHDLIVYYAIVKARERNSNFVSLNSLDRERYLDKVTLKDQKIKSELAAMVMGMMTTDEMNTLLLNESEYKRRINTMIRDRIVSTL